MNYIIGGVVFFLFLSVSYLMKREKDYIEAIRLLEIKIDQSTHGLKKDLLEKIENLELRVKDLEQKDERK